ncbi:MAG: TetR/AcrR family transcriptional regulator, partial [Terracidiphilus sp.]
RKTQVALREALLALMVERGYESLRVQDILDRASVGRATFYLHYRSKEDLLRTSLEELRRHLKQEWKMVAAAEAKSSTLGFSLAFFRHVDSHRRLYRAIVGRESGTIVERQMRRLLLDLVGEEMARSSRRRDSIRSGMTAHYVVGALLSTVFWWLDSNARLSPEEIDSAFRQMTLSALQFARTER